MPEPSLVLAVELWPSDLSGGGLAALLVAAFVAGGIDAVVGGGGLVLIPVLLVVLPGLSSAALLGTNKAAALCGTAAAAVTFTRRVPPELHTVRPMAIAAFAGSLAGAAVITQVSNEVLRPLAAVLLAVVGVYTFFRKDLGEVEAKRLSHRRQVVAATAAGAAIGFYDGFFGPGTGSFLVFVLVGLVGYSFLRASATAKVVNCATNVAALGFFATTGEVLWLLGVVLGVLNVAGSVLGSRLAIARGSRFVRVVFLVVVGALTLRLAYDVLTG